MEEMEMRIHGVEGFYIHIVYRDGESGRFGPFEDKDTCEEIMKSLIGTTVQSAAMTVHRLCTKRTVDAPIRPGPYDIAKE